MNDDKADTFDTPNVERLRADFPILNRGAARREAADLFG